MTRPLGLVLLLAALALGLVFSWYAADMACLDAQRELDAARASLMRECLKMCSLVSTTGALTMRYLPDQVEYVHRAEVARVQIEEQPPMSQVARACLVLYTSLQEMMRRLGQDDEASAHYRFEDVRTSFNEIARRLASARDQYNATVVRYNTVLARPLPRIWNGLLKYPTAETFAVSAADVRAAQLNNSAELQPAGNSGRNR